MDRLVYLLDREIWRIATIFLTFLTWHKKISGVLPIMFALYLRVYNQRLPKGSSRKTRT